MSKGRLEAFSDGVFAIIITVMVLGLRVPEQTDLPALAGVLPVFLGYVLSFVYVGIYWNNHHHMIQLVKRVDGLSLWANLHLLFWLSLFPFVTAWMGRNYAAAIPAALYGCVLLLSALAWAVLQRALSRAEGPDAILRRALGRDFKGWVSAPLYLLGIVCAFWHTWIADALYALVAVMWLVPDRRFEKAAQIHSRQS